MRDGAGLLLPVALIVLATGILGAQRRTDEQPDVVALVARRFASVEPFGAAAVPALKARRKGCEVPAARGVYAALLSLIHI